MSRPEVGDVGVERVSNHISGKQHLSTRGGGYKRWTLLKLGVQHTKRRGAKLIDNFATSPAAETVRHAQRPRLQFAVHEATRRKPTRLNTTQDGMLCCVARAAPNRRVVRPSETLGAISLTTGGRLRGG